MSTLNNKHLSWVLSNPRYVAVRVINLTITLEGLGI